MILIQEQPKKLLTSDTVARTLVVGFVVWAVLAFNLSIIVAYSHQNPVANQLMDN